MSRILLIGGDGGKRKFYFEQAAVCKGLSVVPADKAFCCPSGPERRPVLSSVSKSTFQSRKSTESQEKLIQNNVPVTQMYPQRFSCGEELISYLKEHRIGQVFVKPVRGM